MNQTKEEFVVPKVTQTAWFELEDELLSLSNPPEVTNLIQATGHERVEVTTIDYSYWEEN